MLQGQDGQGGLWPGRLGQYTPTRLKSSSSGPLLSAHSVLLMTHLGGDSQGWVLDVMYESPSHCCPVAMTPMFATGTSAPPVSGNMRHGVGGAHRQHPVLPADRWQPPPAGHRFLITVLYGCGTSAKGLACMPPADAIPSAALCHCLRVTKHLLCWRCLHHVQVQKPMTNGPPCLWARETNFIQGPTCLEGAVIAPFPVLSSVLLGL